MTWPPGVRKAALTVHIVASIGWLGAAAAFLALAITGLVGDDARRVASVYVAADVVARLAIVPLALGALVTGVVQGLVTPWGVFRHYWVVIKLIVTVVAVLVLLGELGTIAYVADVAAASSEARPVTDATARGERVSLVVHAAGGLVVLAVPTVLSTVKPPGLTRYGRRAQLRYAGR